MGRTQESSLGTEPWISDQPLRCAIETLSDRVHAAREKWLTIKPNAPVETGQAKTQKTLSPRSERPPLLTHNR